MKSPGRATVFALGAACIFLCAPAHAQVESREGIALQNEILELRQQMAQLQQLGSGAQGQSSLPPPEQDGAPPIQGTSGDAVAGLLVRVSGIEEQMRSLEGRVSELENAEHRDHDELAKQIGDLAFKLGQGPSPAASAPGTQGPDTLSPPPPPQAGGYQQGSMDLTTPARPPAMPAHRAPELALKQGSAALARRDYAGAEAAAREVLAVGRTARAGDANFLLARAQAGQHEYKDAAATYYGVYKTSPRSPRGAESLLGVSNALIGLGSNLPACQALAKLAAEFPRPEASVRAGMASARKRASCR